MTANLDVDREILQSLQDLLTYTNPYVEQYRHLKEVLEIEGFVAAQRFALAEGPVDGEAPAAPAPYVAIYEIEAESMEQAMANLGAAAGTMNMSAALDLSGAKTFGYTAIGDKQHTR